MVKAMSKGLKSWKTTVAALVGMVAVISQQLQYQWDNNPLTEPNWDTVFALIPIALGLLFARDNDLSSEDVGAGKSKSSGLAVIAFLCLVGVGGVGCDTSGGFKGIDSDGSVEGKGVASNLSTIIETAEDGTPGKQSAVTEGEAPLLVWVDTEGIKKNSAGKSRTIVLDLTNLMLMIDSQSDFKIDSLTVTTDPATGAITSVSVVGFESNQTELTKAGAMYFVAAVDAMKALGEQQARIEIQRAITVGETSRVLGEALFKAAFPGAALIP